MIRWFFRLLRIDNFLIKIEDYEAINNDVTVSQETKQFIWCLVGNVVEKHFYGENKEVRVGTKQFAPNSKVYCFPAMWGDGYEDIKVIGKPRNSHKLITVIMKAEYIKNWRLQKVFHPYVIKKMKEDGGWDNSERSRKDMLSMLKWLPERTREVKE